MTRNMHMEQILEREEFNIDRIYLYADIINGYWNAFQHSALFLKKILGDQTSEFMYKEHTGEQIFSVRIFLDMLEKYGLIDLIYSVSDNYIVILMKEKP